jgi:hypothetical protein
MRSALPRRDRDAVLDSLDRARTALQVARADGPDALLADLDTIDLALSAVARLTTLPSEE